MSWSVQAPSQTAATLEGAARQKYEEFVSHRGDDEAGSAADEQFEAALAAARTIVESGAVGESAVRVSLSGHANPGHAKRDGWANDTVTVSISQH